MGGLPKFLLPSTGTKNQAYSGHGLNSLLEQHINYGLEFADTVVIATRPENAFLLKPFLRPKRVELIAMETLTMAETIIRVSSLVQAAQNLVLMPDTHFSGNFNSKEMALVGTECISVALWRIKPHQIGSVGQIEVGVDERENLFVTKHLDKKPDCTFPYLWGAMNISDEGMALIEESMPHCGYLISKLIENIDSNNRVGARLQEGEYHDCGTPEGYFDHLNL
jgi:UTP-glucose-1-phosphate uridylyltransferase